MEIDYYMLKVKKEGEQLKHGLDADYLYNQN